MLLFTAKIIPKASFQLYSYLAGNKVLYTCAIAFTWTLLSLCNITAPKPKLLASFTTIISFFGLYCVKHSSNVNSFLFFQKRSNIQNSSSISNLFFNNLCGALNTCIFEMRLTYYIASPFNGWRADIFVGPGMFFITLDFGESSFLPFSSISNKIKARLATVVEGEPKAPFLIATTPMCWGERYSFPRIAPLYPWSLPYSAKF